MTITPTPNSWLVCPQKKLQARLRLFCFPYAGGGASLFRTWANDLPPEVEVYAIQYPGRENRLRETPFTNLFSLVETLVPILHPVLDCPFAFFGHSLGGIVIFELTRRLYANFGLAPVRLFASGSRAPQLPARKRPIHALPDAEFMEELRKFQGTPDAILQNKELMEVLVPVLRADLEMFETYTFSPAEPLTCPISAFGGWQDHEVNYEEILAWREQTQGEFTVRMFPGDHFFLQSMTVRQPLLKAISHDLAVLQK